jgi:flagellar biosynthesis component FlhA
VATSGLPDPPRALGELWSRLLPDATSYWRLVDALAADSADPATGAVREGLLGFLTHRFCGDADGTATPLAPVATPVVVCLGEGLVPDDAATTWRSWRLFTSDIPELRARISEQIGVTLPGFNVRGAGDTLPLDGYTLSLDGAFRRRGRVRADGWFLRDCDAADLPPDAVLDRASDPRTGRPGAWVSPDDGRAVRGRGGEVWDDPIEYVVADLESLLRENLDLFLRIDDVERLLDRSVDPAVMAAALPTPEDRRRFAWALRHAVRRRHLIGDLPAVLQAYAGAGPATEARLEAVLAVTPAVEGLS